MKVLMNIAIAIGLGIKRNLHIFIGLILGVVFGLILHSYTHDGVADTKTVATIISVLDFIGKIFIRSIQMVVIPLVFSAIVIGVSSMGDNKQLGKIGKKMILYYGIITVIAVIIGAFLSVGFKPGVGVPIDTSASQNMQQILTLPHICLRLFPKKIFADFFI